METAHLIDNYTFAVDAATFVICITLLVLIRFVLYFSIDKKFQYLKRSVHIILVGALSNIGFGLVCQYFPNQTAVLYLLRNIHHCSLMCCMFVFLLYIQNMLDIESKYMTLVLHLTRTVSFILMTLDVLSPFTKFGLHRENGLWYDPLVSPYNVFYCYGVLMLFILLICFYDRLIKPVRWCLIITEMIVIFVMINGGIHNTNTFTSFTYVLPVLVVLILLHSKPFDDVTGAMSAKSFDSYAERAIRKKISHDYMILQMNMSVEENISTELGKVLTAFWRKYFRDALFFSLNDGTYVLAIARTKRNGDIKAKINKLFFEVFPIYQKKYQLPYKMIALFDIDFFRKSDDVRDTITYLTIGMEENSVLVADEKLTGKLRIMRSVKDHLADIQKKNDLNDERVLVYCQPIFNTKNGQFDTAESLMRLRIPEQEFVTPDLFIPLAENYGYIHTLSKIILNKVCRQIKELTDEGYEFNRISVNFAVSELLEKNFCNEVIDIIKANGIDPKKIGMELTESQSDSEFNMLKDKVSILKAQGITMYLDDFGTGYSNLDRIIRIGLDVIKYDRSILLAAEEDDNITYMIKHFAGAFRKFEFKLLFEGVEDEKQEALCLECGADYLQGYKFSKPIPIERLREFFKKSV